MITIYNKQGGGSKTLDPVDAREHVNSGRWQYNDPADEDDDMSQSAEASAVDLNQLRDEMSKIRGDFEISEEARLKAVKDLGDVEAEFEKSESELSRARNTIVRLEKDLSSAHEKLALPDPKIAELEATKKSK